MIMASYPKRCTNTLLERHFSDVLVECSANDNDAEQDSETTPTLPVDRAPLHPRVLPSSYDTTNEDFQLIRQPRCQSRNTVTGEDVFGCSATKKRKKVNGVSVKEEDSCNAVEEMSSRTQHSVSSKHHHLVNILQCYSQRTEVGRCQMSMLREWLDLQPLSATLCTDVLLILMSAKSAAVADACYDVLQLSYMQTSQTAEARVAFLDSLFAGFDVGRCLASVHKMIADVHYSDGCRGELELRKSVLALKLISTICRDVSQTYQPHLESNFLRLSSHGQLTSEEFRQTLLNTTSAAENILSQSEPSPKQQQLKSHITVLPAVCRSVLTLAQRCVVVRSRNVAKIVRHYMRLKDSSQRQMIIECTASAADRLELCVHLLALCCTLSLQNIDISTMTLHQLINSVFAEDVFLSAARKSAWLANNRSAAEERCQEMCYLLQETVASYMNRKLESRGAQCLEEDRLALLRFQQYSDNIRVGLSQCPRGWNLLNASSTAMLQSLACFAEFIGLDSTSADDD